MKKYTLIYVIITLSYTAVAQNQNYKQDTGFLIYHESQFIYFIPVKNFYHNKSFETLTDGNLKAALVFMSEIWDSLYLKKWATYSVIKNNRENINKILVAPAVVSYIKGKEDLIDGIQYCRKYLLLIGAKKKSIRFKVDLRNEIIIGDITFL